MKNIENPFRAQLIEARSIMREMLTMSYTDKLGTKKVFNEHLCDDQNCVISRAKALMASPLPVDNAEPEQVVQCVDPLAMLAIAGDGIVRSVTHHEDPAYTEAHKAVTTPCPEPEAQAAPTPSNVASGSECPVSSNGTPTPEPQPARSASRRGRRVGTVNTLELGVETQQ